MFVCKLIWWKAELFEPSRLNSQLYYLIQIAYSLLEEQEGRTKTPDNYISFVSLLADSRYCGIILILVPRYSPFFYHGNLCFLFIYLFFKIKKKEKILG